MDTEHLVLDLANPGKALVERSWRDDGLLPAPAPIASASGALHYTFAQHRLLTGQEELLCRGYPVARLRSGGLDDAKLRALRPSACRCPSWARRSLGP